MDSTERLELFLAQWRELTCKDPQGGLALLAEGWRLLEEMEQETGLPQTAFRARLTLAEANALTILGELESAQKIFTAAHVLVAEVSSWSLLADYYRIRALHSMRLGRNHEALDYARFAAHVYEHEKNEHGHGRALNVCGHILWEMGRLDAAISDLTRAVAMVDPEKNARAHQTAHHNLTIALAEATAPDQIQHAINEISEARRTDKRGRPTTRRWRPYTGRRQKTIADAKLRWELGRLFARLGIENRAIEFFETAREDLAELGLQLDVAEIALDLGPLYIGVGRWERLEEIAADAVSVLKQLPGSEAAAQAFELWRRAVDERAAQRVDELARKCRDDLASAQETATERLEA
jgi:tetratricopeptide (TPR) repeat protein